MDKPFSAYEGGESYVFVCYAHADAAVVYRDLGWLNDHGANIWYDEGISPGKNWRATIGKALLDASSVLVYLSKASLRSDHCNREINLALDEGKTIVPVYLEPIELSPDLKIGLNRVQALNADKKASHRIALLGAIDQEQSIKPRLISPRKLARRSVAVAALCSLLVAFAVGSWFVFNGEAKYLPHPSAYNLYDRSFDAMGLTHQVELLEKALDYDAGFLDARARLANSLVMIGSSRANQALPTFRRARDEALTVLAEEPKHALATLVLARTYLQMDRNARKTLLTLDSVDLAATVPSQYPTGGHEPLIALLKTIVFLNTGKYELAENTMSAAYKLYPKAGGVASHYALALYMSHKVDSAWSMFDEALRLNPTSPTAIPYAPLMAAAEKDATRIRELNQMIQPDALIPPYGEPLAAAIEGDYEPLRKMLAFYEDNREQYGLSATSFTESFWWSGEYEKHIRWYKMREREGDLLFNIKFSIARKPNYWETLEAWSVEVPGAIEYRGKLLSEHRSRIQHLTLEMI